MLASWEGALMSTEGIDMGQSKAPTTEEAARILAAVRRETRSYTDPRAEYPIAQQARDARLAGAGRRIH